MRSWIPGINYGAHAFGLKSFDEFLEARDSMIDQINQYSPYAQLTADDPLTYLFSDGPG